MYKNFSAKKVSQKEGFEGIHPSFLEDARQRDLLEMQRRFKGLQVRRSHLESELQAVKNCLTSLDRQMQSSSAYKQLSLRN